MAYSLTKTEEFHSKNHTNTRVIFLKPKAGKAKGTTGLLDNRLFSGENKLLAIMDTETCLWHFKYESGILPQVLKQRFTSLKKATDYARDYFLRRNVEIVSIVDG